MREPSTKTLSQITGNTGLFHIARELSRRGWYVTLTVRNARGADLFAANANETVVHAIQSKALSKRSDVPLGSSLERLRSPWWVITLNANSSSPTCYVLSLEEVKQLAGKNAKEGKDSYWLGFRHYTSSEFEEAWHRLGDPMDEILELAEQ